MINVEDVSPEILAQLMQETSKKNLRMVKQLDYYNRSYKGMSYSRSSTLSACPRKFEIASKFRLRPRVESVTFAYGHAVGAGVQSILSGESLDRALLAVLFNYDCDIERVGNYGESVANKSYWDALVFVEKFHYMYHNGAMPFLTGWEIAVFQRDGAVIPGVELTFVIDLGDGFTYEGHIDLVLYNKEKNRYLVLELKTNGGNVVSSTAYCNSAQALGYGVVIDNIAGDLKASASFDVLYLVAKSRTKEIIPLLFTKTPMDKAKWIMQTLTEKAVITMYESQDFYPSNGGSCFDFFRDCEYLNFCKRSNEELEIISNNTANMDTVVFTKLETPTFMFSIDQIIERQQLLDKYAYDNSEIDMLLNVTNVNLGV